MLKKIILWGLVIAIAVVILGIAGIYIFFPKEKAKEMAIEKISTVLDREVTIDGISVSFWGGIGAYLEGIKIVNAEGFPEELFMDAKALDVKVQFWPLLSKEIKVDRLILEEPKISLRKLNDGRVNYQFGAVDSAAEAAGIPEQVPQESKLAVSAISFENLLIDNGTLTMIDDSSGYELTATGINLSTKLTTEPNNIFHTRGKLGVGSIVYRSDSLTTPPIKLNADYDSRYDFAKNHVTLNSSSASVGDIPLTYSGNISIGDQYVNMDLKVETDKVAYEKAAAMIPMSYMEMLAGYDIAGDLKLSSEIKYISDSLIPNFNLGLSDFEIKAADYPSMVKITSGDISGDLSEIKFKINQGDIDGGQFKTDLTIHPDTAFENYEVSGSADGGFDLAAFDAYLPESGNPSMSGKMDFDLTFALDTRDLAATDLKGNMKVTDAAYKAETLPEPIEKLDLDMEINSRDITIRDMLIKFTSSDIRLKGALTNAFPYFLPGYDKPATKPFLAFKMESQRFDVDKLFPEAAPGAGAAYAGKPADSIPPIILPDINGKGSGRIDTLIYTNVEFTNINSLITIKDRKINVTNVNGDVYTGKVTGETEIDLNDFNNPVFNGKFSAKQVEANDFLTRFTDFGGHLYGKLNLDGDFTAKGIEPEDILKSLTMDGNALFNEAKVQNFDLLNNMSQQFNLGWETEEKVRDFVSHFSVAEGRVKFDDLKFLSKYGDFNISGSAGMFDGSLNYDGDLLMNKEQAEKIADKLGVSRNLVSLLKDKQTGKYTVPFGIGGTYEKPTFKLKLDLQKMMQESLQDNLKDKATDGLKKLFGK